MRSYRQHCMIAKALDVVGDRWTLLIVRELMLQGPCRFTDLRNGLPGIATNLLSTRLRELEVAGLIRREAAPPPVATTLFHLTDTGRDLDPVLQALGLWGARLTVPAASDDTFQAHWLTYPLRWFLHDNRPDDPELNVQLQADGEPLVVTAADGQVTARPGTTATPDVTLEGGADRVLAVLAGVASLEDAPRLGVRITGNPRALHRVIPASVHPALASLRPAPGSDVDATRAAGASIG